MIIWRGWGILAILCAVPGFLVSSVVFQGNADSGGFAGLGFLLGGVLCYLLGRWLNEVRPAKKLEELSQQFGPEQAGLYAKQLRNQHTLFFIPIQYLGILAAAGGLVFIVGWLFGVTG
ncbi:MAG: hypothetical protein Q4D79_08770 [Propionibacteriaceae bacterium]|nr:hypothetical protein [Propionibacteriaceae bacterium]